MTPALVLVGLLLLALPGWSQPTRNSVGPVRWARSCRTALALGLVLTLSGLLLWGAPIVLHLADGWGLPGLCDDAIHRLPLGGLEVALAAMAAGVWIVARFAGAIARAITRSRDARIDPLIGRHRDLSEFDVVVIPSTRLVAVGVPGSRPQIVISEGLVAVLEPNELDAVIGHEMAHHRLGHRNYMVLAAAVDQVFGWLPPVRVSTDALRNAVEEWADRASTRRSPERVATLRSALRRLADVHVTTSARRHLKQRLDRLDGAESRDGPRRASTIGMVAGFSVVGGTLSLVVVVAQQLFAAVGRCAS